MMGTSGVQKAGTDVGVGLKADWRKAAEEG